MSRTGARLSGGEKLLTLLFFFYWVVYENLIFFYPAEFGGLPLVAATNAIKLLLPLVLLVVVGFPPARVLGRSPVGSYLLVFLAFLLWALVPTVISGDVVEWLKLLPRVAFFLAAISLFARRPPAFTLLAKCVVLYVLSALVQYGLVYATGAYSSLQTFGPLRAMAGPYGLLGNVNATNFFPGVSVPIVRLTGFWNEPSNAAGSAMAAFFLGRYLASIGERRFWRRASYACLLAGFLTLSLAGYFALGSAVLFGMLFGVRRVSFRRAARLLILLPIPVAILLVVAFGRTYVAEAMPDNPWLRAVAGVRSIEAVAIDPTAGRLELAKQSIQTTRESAIGLGLQVVGSEGIQGSGTAPLLWMLLTGFPGLFLLLWREAVLLRAASKMMRLEPGAVPVAQALIAVMAQHLSYGSWMNPNYFIFAAMVLVSTGRYAEQRRLRQSEAR